MLDARFSHLYFYQSLNRLQRGLSAIAELLVIISSSSIICKLYVYVVQVKLDITIITASAWKTDAV